MEIGKPVDFTNVLHITVDENSPCGSCRPPSFIVGLKGLPEEWRLALEASNISKTEIIQNHDAVINVLNYQFKEQPMPTAKDMMDVDAMLRDSAPSLTASWVESFIREEDPKLYYRGIKEMIGEGGYSTV